MATFTKQIKDEMALLDANPIEAMSELAAFVRFDAVFKNKTIIITIDNPKIAKRIFNFFKEIYGIDVKIIVRVQHRFKLKQVYILEIKEKYKFILESLNILEENKKILPSDYLLETDEEKKSFLRGLFLSSGSITDPKNGTYHMEYLVKTKKEADYVKNFFKNFDAKAKLLKRNAHYIVYIKSSETISEFIKIFGAVNSLFYFEDIRIYRDHKNMVNRLNNCEIANQEKTIKNGMKQLEDINYLESNNLIPLLDEKTKTVIDYRKKYPETSYYELASIISLETEKNNSKSTINHCFIKIRELIKKHKK